jgi:hypothetical protein
MLDIIQYVQDLRFWLPNLGGLVALLRCLDRSLNLPALFSDIPARKLLFILNHLCWTHKVNPNPKSRWLLSVMADPT